MSGLLFVLGEVGTDVREDEFNDWYDNEHAPARLTVPGIKNALRYKALDDERPAYIAMYDTESPLTLQSDQYRSLALGASQRERGLIPKLEMLHRRIYELHSTTSRNEVLDAPAAFIQVVTPVVDAQTEFSIEEYAKQNTMVPGCLRTRRFKLISAVEVGGGLGTDPTPNYLILHDFDDRDSLLHHKGPPQNASLKIRNFYLHKEIK